MVRISHRRIQQKKKSPTQPIEIPSNPIDQSSSSKILNVVRQALLNAAEELVSQQQEQLNNSIPFQILDINNNNNSDSNKSRQRNGNSIKKKKLIQKKKNKSSQNHRRK